MKTKIIIFFIAVWLLTCGFNVSSETRNDDALFLTAKNAVKIGNWEQFNNIKSQLQNYLLYPYLEYYAINKDFQMITADTVQQYINKYPQSPMASQLLRHWLTQLADKNEWQQFIKFYKPTNDTNVTCNYLRALQQAHQQNQAENSIKTLWMTGSTLPESCNFAFAAWLNQNADKNKLLWLRFELALKKYNFDLAHSLSRELSGTDRQQSEEIINLYHHPDLITQKSYLNKQSSAEVISYGIAWFARRDPSAAVSLYERLSHHYSFNPGQQQRIFQAIALKFAMHKDPQATIWFRKVVGAPLDPVYQEWLVRTAIYHNDWKLVRDSIAAFSVTDRESDRWQYWYATALNHLNQPKQANAIFNKLAEDNSYHGFLASRKDHQTFHFKNEIPRVSEADKEFVAQLPGLQRAKLLYQLKQIQDAKVELRKLMQLTTPLQQYLIIAEVSAWGWTHEALYLSDTAPLQGDINMRFPLSYKDIIMANAAQRKIDPALIYAIIREESLFSPTANSPAGAKGLMQLMPSTASKTAKQFKLAYKTSSDLLNDKTNIVFGTAHLKKLAEEFNYNPVLMIAAYNAGKEAVYRWLPHDREVPADVWIETIPFNETRHYLKNVIASYLFYQQRLQQIPNLDRMMQNIKPR